MTQIGAPTHDPINIGDEAAPPFAVLPVPSELFRRRARRLNALASGHEIGGYLEFVGRICQLQNDIQQGLPEPVLPSAEQLAQARDGTMPPLGSAEFGPDAAFEATLDRLLSAILDESNGWPEPARHAANIVRAMDAAAVADAMDAIAADKVPADEIAAHVLLSAATEVHYARAAALLDVASLQPIADGVCPACGAAPIASEVVGRPGAQSTRFCTCVRCATQWNVVRVKCVRCGTTGGIRYMAIDGKPDTIKGETCDACHGYVKIFYSVKDPEVEPLADDIASLGLDMKLVEAGWRRLGRNVSLTGTGLDAPGGAADVSETKP